MKLRHLLLTSLALAALIILAAPSLAGTPAVVVNSTADTDDGACSALGTGTGNKDCTLREALTHTVGSYIVFHIPLAQGTDIDSALPGGDAANDVFVIAPLTPLPALTGNTALDGTTEATFLGSDTNPAGPEIVLDGSNPNVRPPNFFGAALSLNGNNSLVRGLVINNGFAAGISIFGVGGHLLARNNHVEGCYVGTNARGTAASALPVENGILLTTDGSTAGSGAQDNIIGGTTPAARNLVSGNHDYGIAIAGVVTTGNDVRGNYIGTNAAGTAALPNGRFGVAVFAPNNTVGGTDGDDGAEDGVVKVRNVISGNPEIGVWLAGVNSTGNLVQGNYIGTNAAGTAKVSNGNGVVISDDSVNPGTGADNNTVGGTGAGAGNVISGNSDTGVSIVDTDTAGATGNLVQGNLIGLNATGATALANGGDGVFLRSFATANTIGGLTAGARNIISGNGGNGVHIQGAGATGNLVQGNFIGTNAAGTLARSNSGDGVFLRNVANNTIGGAAATPGQAPGNVISGNARNGVWIDRSDATGNLVQGNLIGLALNGTNALPNTAHGVLINGGSSNVIGLALDGSGAPNKIWRNGGGVAVIASGADLARSVRGANGISVPRAVSVNPGNGNVIRGNSARANGGLNIDLGDDGVTSNDANDDSDFGANDLQNFPVLTSAVLGFNKTNTTLGGTLQSKPNSTYRLDFYRSNSASSAPAASEAGTLYLGNMLVTTDATGNLTSPFSFNAGAPSTSCLYAATATDTSTGDTSEFSASFFQESVRPTISITAPNPAGGALTVGADFPQIGGTATDNVPGVTVRLHLIRVSDGLYWNGTTFGAAQTILPTAIDGSGNWNSTGALPKPAPANPVTLRDDKYQIVAYAIDTSGNQLVASKTLSYDLHKPTVSISTPGSPGQPHNSMVNIMSLTTVSGSAAHPLVGMKKVLLKLVRSVDNAQWNGSIWVPASSPAQWMATTLDDAVGSSPAAWHKTDGFPAVNGSATNGLEVGMVYNLSAASYDRLDQASNTFVLRVKIVSSLSVFTLPPSHAAASEPSE